MVAVEVEGGAEGLAVRGAVGMSVGETLGESMVDTVGESVGDAEGARLGMLQAVGPDDGTDVGAELESLETTSVPDDGCELRERDSVGLELGAALRRRNRRRRRARKSRDDVGPR